VSEQIKDWQRIEGCNFQGKWVRDMDRNELYAVIDYLLNDNRQQRNECVMMMNALCDTRRRRGGAFMKWLFG
jgi:hypothetical protein